MSLALKEMVVPRFVRYVPACITSLTSNKLAVGTYGECVGLPGEEDLTPGADQFHGTLDRLTAVDSQGHLTGFTAAILGNIRK